jgi:hypothetical protein
MAFSGVNFLRSSEISAVSTEILDDSIVVFAACASCSEGYRFKFGPNVFVALFIISKNGPK